MEVSSFSNLYHLSNGKLKVGEIAFSILLLIIIPVAGVAQSQVTVIKNVSIVDVVNSRVVNQQVVVIESGKIFSVGQSTIPTGAAVIEAKGKYLMPGLWDMHTHTLRKGRVSTFFPLFIANGVTGIRDMASDMTLEEIKALKLKVESGEIPGPRIGAFTGRIFDGPPQPDTLLFTYPSSPESARQKVQWYKERGAGFIKVYNMLSKEMYTAIAAACKASNIPFAGHVPFAITAIDASDAGQRSIEHLSDLLLSAAFNEQDLRSALLTTAASNAIQSTRKRMEINFEAAKNYSPEKAAALCSVFIRNKTWHCPTLRNLQIISTHASLPLLMNDGRLKYFTAALKESWKKSLLSRLTGDSLQRATYFQRSLQLVSQMQQSGVPLLAGTDLSSSFQMPGFSLADELQLMVEAGLSAGEALRTATINPAIFLHLESETGSVAAGKIADLVLLDGNPLQDIRNVKRISAVILNGKYFARSELDKMLTQVEEEVRKADNNK